MGCAEFPTSTEREKVLGEKVSEKGNAKTILFENIEDFVVPPILIVAFVNVWRDVFEYELPEPIVKIVKTDMVVGR